MLLIQVKIVEKNYRISFYIREMYKSLHFITKNEFLSIFLNIYYIYRSISELKDEFLILNINNGIINNNGYY